MSDVHESRSVAAAGAPDEEIEITPAMIDAGLGWLFRYDRDFDNAERVVKEIIRAALANRGRLVHPRVEEKNSHGGFQSL